MGVGGKYSRSLISPTRLPPALKAGITDHLWTLEELVELIDRESSN
jgi:hypothetical protein